MQLWTVNLQPWTARCTYTDTGDCAALSIPRLPRPPCDDIHAQLQRRSAAHHAALYTAMNVVSKTNEPGCDRPCCGVSAAPRVSIILLLVFQIGYRRPLELLALYCDSGRWPMTPAAAARGMKSLFPLLFLLLLTQTCSPDSDCDAPNSHCRHSARLGPPHCW